MALEVDLLAVDRGLVVAPAGCGKTQLIVDALAHYQGARPILVLTSYQCRGRGAARPPRAGRGIGAIVPASHH